MTREEAIARIKDHMIIHKMNEPRAIYISEALDMAIKALAQEPCEDCINRHKAIIQLSHNKTGNDDVDVVVQKDIETIKALPPVTPGSTSCDVAISKQAVIDMISDAQILSDESGEHCGYCTEDIDIESIPSVNPQPCGDAISREDVEECKELMTDINGDTVYAVRMSNIRQLSPVDPQTKMGKWIIVDDCERFIAKCSECGRIEDSRMINKYPYCHCGGKDGGSRRMNTEELNREIAFIDLVLGAIKNVARPILVYDEEKEVVKKALTEYKYKLESELRGR